MRHLLVNALLASTLGAWAAPATAQQQPGAGVLDIANPGSPASLDPHLITGVWENRIVGDMFVGLTTEGVDGSIQPGAAESWTRSEDGLRYTFEIRDHEWSDGSVVTAADFEYSFKRMLAPETASPYADFYFVIEGAEAYTKGEGPAEDVGVTAVDEDTLRIELIRPTAYFTGLLMHFAAMPVPRTAIEHHGEEWTRPGNIVVNGAFVLDERVPNSHVRLVRNARFYAAESVALEAVVHHVQEDRDAAVQRYRAGEFDIVRDFPSRRIDWLRDTLGADEVHTEPYLGLTFIAVNHGHEALDDLRVRRALAMALDRRVLARQVLGSGERPALSLVPPGADNYDEPARFEWAGRSMEQRLTRARELVRAAGYGQDRPLRLTMRYPVSDNLERVAVAVQSMLSRIGVELELATAETAIHYARLQQRDFDLGIARWLAVYSDPQTFTLLLESKTVANNFGGFSSARYDELTDRASRAADVAERAEYLREAERLALAECGLIPLYHHASRNLVAPHVGGWQDNYLDVHRSRYLEIVED